MASGFGRVDCVRILLECAACLNTRGTLHASGQRPDSQRKALHEACVWVVTDKLFRSCWTIVCAQACSQSTMERRIYFGFRLCGGLYVVTAQCPEHYDSPKFWRRPNEIRNMNPIKKPTTMPTTQTYPHAGEGPYPHAGEGHKLG